MTALGAPGLAAPGAQGRPPDSPTARRLQPPRWRDGRLLAGVLLLLVSVVVGARLLATGDSTSPVVAVTRELPAGHVLAAEDLATTRVRLSSTAAGAYVAGAALATLPGRLLARGVRPGELLPVAAVAAAGATAQRTVPVKVRDGRHPALTAGDRVDVFATGSVRPAGSPPGTAGVCTTLLVVAAVEVAADAPLDAGSADATLLLRVAPEQAATLVHASETAALDVTRHLVVGDEPPAPTPAPVQGIGAFASAGCGAGR